MRGWELVAEWEVVAMAPVVTTFVVLYGLFWPWWTSAQGRALFVAKVGMALLVDFAVAYQFWPAALPDVHYVAVFVYGVILVGQAGLVIALIASWRNRHARWRKEPAP